MFNQFKLLRIKHGPSGQECNHKFHKENLIGPKYLTKSAQWSYVNTFILL